MYPSVVFNFISVLNALQGILKFYESNHKALDLDGLMGLRFIEGQLKHTLIDYGKIETFLNLKPKSFDILSEMISNASAIANKATPFVYEKDPAYFSPLQKLLSVPWSVSGNARKTDKKFIWANHQNGNLQFTEKMVEKETDACIAELLIDDNCNKLSRKCLDYMLIQKDTSGYSLCHQVLYASIAQMFFCENDISKFLQQNGKYDQSIDLFYDEACSNLLVELNHMLEKPQFNEDLFLEIVFACGTIGYVEFAHSDHLKKILSWQNPEIGCFMNENIPKEQITSKLLFSDVDSKKNICNNHKVTVAAGALSFYLRFLVTFEPKYLISASFGPNDKIVNEPTLHFWSRPFSKMDDYVRFVSVGSSSLLNRREKIVKKAEISDNTEEEEEAVFALALPPHFTKIDQTIFASLFMMALFLMIIGYTLWVKKLAKVCPTRRKLFKR